MADINSLIALGGGGMRPFDITEIGKNVLDLQGKQIANDTGAFNLAQGQQRQSALEDYNKRQVAGDPNAIGALNTQPDAMATITQARNSMDAEQRTKFDTMLAHRARAANAVAIYPANSAERLNAWNAQLDELKGVKAISDDQYKQLHGKEPSDMLLQQYIAAGLAVPQYMDYAVKKAGIGAAQQFGTAVQGALGPGGAPAAPGAPAPQSAAPPAAPNERRVVQSESGGNPAAVNDQGFAGTYQFGAPRAAALGVYTPGPGENLKTWSQTYKSAPNKWTGEFNIPGFPDVKNIKDFLANPDAQRAVYQKHREAMSGEIKDNGFDKYVGTRVGGVLITRDGLENMLHLGGVASTRRALESDGKDNPADANKKTVLDYARMAPLDLNPTEPAARNTGAGAPDPIKSLVPAALAAIATPGVPEGVGKAAQAIIDWAKQDSKPTDLGKNYDDYVTDARARGEVPMSRLEYEIKVKNAGATNVNVDTKGENAESMERGKGVAERLNAIAKSGDEAYAQRAIVGRLGKTLDESGSGAGIAFANWVRENFGDKIGGAFATKKKLELAESATGLINYLKPRMRVAGTGASSDKDLEAFGRSIPNLMSTEGGRRLITETLGGIQESLVQRSDIATRWQTGDLTAANAFGEMHKLGDPFKAFREYQTAQEGNAGAPAAETPRFKSMDEVVKAIADKKLQAGDQFWVMKDGEPMVGTVPQPPRGAVAPVSVTPAPDAAPSRRLPEAPVFEVPH